MLVVLALVGWFAVFTFIHRHLKNTPVVEIPSWDKTTSLAILVAARNEAANIVPLLASIENQHDLPRDTRVYIADDHSTDGTAEAVAALVGRFKNFKLHLISSEGVGKKAALQTLLAHAQADLLYFTDADCTLAPHTIEKLATALNGTQKIAAFGAVLFYEKRNWFNRLLMADNLNTQAVTEAFFHCGSPLMANGANMMVRAEAKPMVLQSHASGTHSGDDTFFAQQLTPAQYAAEFEREAVVHTHAPQTLRALVHQRVRWASKSVKYPSWTAKGFALIVFALSAVWLAGVMLLAARGLWILAALAVFCKCAIEYSFHRLWFAKYSPVHHFSTALILSIAHPLYVCGVATLSVMGVGYRWKGRTYKR